ncbi:hypothetical protein [Microbacterium sp. RURRCA19A]|uniref:hypothetical protein n=1 Tax=Microbacterium sp. RURRCA19A TaxID=1907391 RepID=UPI000954F29F|nr:hypothetical protein [Microbacterium sp. RURRCA19A]SIR56176.1 hypothetical protein SAMN05880568_0456 [Microbacterium sp. RURRCA19A]
MTQGPHSAPDGARRLFEDHTTPAIPRKLVNAEDIIRLARRSSDVIRTEQGQLVRDGDEIGYAIGQKDWETCIRVGWSRMHQQRDWLESEAELIECVVKAAHSHADLIADRAISARHLHDAQRQISSAETEGARQHWKSVAILMGARARRIEADLRLAMNLS